MKTIQCLTVAVMMAVMVYTAPTPETKDESLKDICDTTLNVLKKSTKLHLRVKKIGQDGGPPCVHNFFCLAEKSLEDATKNHQLHGETLIQRLKLQLVSFNIKNGITQCHLHTNIEYPLKEFLGNITKCVDLQRTILNHQ